MALRGKTPPGVVERLPHMLMSTSYSDALEALDPSRVQGAMTKAYKWKQYVEEERRRNRPEMAPPLRFLDGAGHSWCWPSLLVARVLGLQYATLLAPRPAPKIAPANATTITSRHQRVFYVVGERVSRRQCRR